MDIAAVIMFKILPTTSNLFFYNFPQFSEVITENSYRIINALDTLLYFPCLDQ